MNYIDKRLTLQELNSMVARAVASAMPASCWVMAEIGELTEHPSGHCYMELCQKDEHSNALIARAKAMVWSNVYRMLKPYFETTAGCALQQGIKVLLSVRPIFHELYGYSLQVVDIEPSYTLGEVEQHRRATMQQLIDDGVAGMNRELPLPLLPRRLAVVSAEKAAGLQDFVQHIAHNPHGFCITHELFAATMQGDGAERSIIEALGAINDERHRFDAVVIVRGGGAHTDLACFDSYNLAMHVAQFPLPVIAGIGHDKDQSVVDMVAHTSVKTPTAVAEFILSRFTAAQRAQGELIQRLASAAHGLVQRERSTVAEHERAVAMLSTSMLRHNRAVVDMRANQLPALLGRQLAQDKARLVAIERSAAVAGRAALMGASRALQQAQQRLDGALGAAMQRARHRLDEAEAVVRHLHPDNLLSMGYSITRHGGRAITDPSSLRSGDVVVTQLRLGVVRSVVRDAQTDR